MSKEEVVIFVLQIIVLPLLAYLVRWAVAFFQAKTDVYLKQIEDSNVQSWLTEIRDIVSNCVLATTQTYVDTLKKNNQFDLNAQKNALAITKDSIMNNLSDEAKAYIESNGNDIEEYITTLIEAKIAEQK